MTEGTRVSNPYYAYGLLYVSPNFQAWETSKGADYKEYRRAWADRIAKLDPGEFPLNLNMEITTRCNLACTFCSQPSLTKDQLGDMSWDLYTQVALEAEKYHVPAANLNGLGEPVLVRRLPDMIAFAKQHGFLDVMFHTNGTLMTETMARSLIESGVDRVIFSVDTPDKETYESMRINARWDKTVENVKRFARIRNEMGKEKDVMIRTTMVVTERTAPHVPEFLRFWQGTADQITLQDLTWRTKELANGKWTNRERSAIPVDLDEIREEARRRNMGFVCPYLYQATYPFWNKDIIPCSNPNARKHMAMGNLEKQTIREIWLGKSYRDLRNLHTSGRWYEHPVCRECEIPLVELYKELQRQGVKFSNQKAAGESPVIVAPVVSPEKHVD